MEKTVYKLIFCITLLAFFSVHPKDVQKKSLDPKKTIILCDLDEVIISGREGNYMRWLMFPSNWSFALTVKKVRKKFKLYDPAQICQKIRELYPKMLKQADEFEKVIGSAQVKKKTAEIIRAVSHKGYPVIAASNMAKSTYKILLKKKTLPNFFSEKTFFVKTKKCNKKADDSYHQKPDPEYFVNVKRYVQKKYPNQAFEYYVFIDDKKANVRAASKAGFIAIHYKESHQLKRSLTMLGIVF